MTTANGARIGFALKGKSVRLDPRTNAVRPDLADIRLAEYVFAPHYAAAAPMKAARAVALREAPEPDSKTMLQLNPGDIFEVLDITGGKAWGVAVPSGLVGYVAADALAPVTGK